MLHNKASSTNMNSYYIVIHCYCFSWAYWFIFLFFSIIFLVSWGKSNRLNVTLGAQLNTIYCIVSCHIMTKHHWSLKQTLCPTTNVPCPPVHYTWRLSPPPSAADTCGEWKTDEWYGHWHQCESSLASPVTQYQLLQSSHTFSPQNPAQQLITYYAPRRRGGAVSNATIRPSVSLSVPPGLGAQQLAQAPRPAVLQATIAADPSMHGRRDVDPLWSAGGGAYRLTMW